MSKRKQNNNNNIFESQSKGDKLENNVKLHTKGLKCPKT